MDAVPVVTGSVVDLPAFQKGGTLVLGSFKPGAGAVANDETDRLSAMMIKGIRDTLPGKNSRFTISTEGQENPDCYLDGYIENYGNDIRSTHLKLRKNQVLLSLDGEIWLRETGAKIFFFKTSSIIDLKTQDPKAAAYQTGIAIADFIGSQS